MRERIIAEELQAHGWREEDLLARRKSDPVKLELGARLRRETTPLKAIAARVHLGTSKAANMRLDTHVRGSGVRMPGGNWATSEGVTVLRLQKLQELARRQSLDG